MIRTLEIGALCPSISKQLDGLISSDDAERLDRDNDAITRCYIRGLVGESETTRARRRLLAKVQKAVTAHAKSNVEISHDRERKIL